MSTTLNLPLEAVPFDRAISVRTFLRPLVQHLQDPKVTEIAIVREGHLYARTDGHWVSHDGEELSYPHLEALATALAAYNHMARSPIMSVVLPDGERGQIILPPACIDGTIAINIRKHAAATFHLEQLAAGGTFNGTVDATNKYSADGLSEVDQRLLLLEQGRLFRVPGERRPRAQERGDFWRNRVGKNDLCPIPHE
jgi:Type IV secretory pathway, VirB11 components, and related ATPases involved in archaeal flagella biosynthesis